LFDQNHDSIFFSFWSIKPGMLSASMLGNYFTSASSTPSCFPRRTGLIGKPVSHHVVTRPTFPFSSLFWIIMLAIMPVMMLGYYS
jgi:hypothetical protein